MAALHPPGQPADDAGPVVLDRRQGPHGEVVLRRHGELFQIIANGCFLMDTSDGRSERLLVSAALEALDDVDALDGERPAPRVLIGGLGVGFSLAEAAAEPRWGAITVVEREPAVVDWHREGPLSEVTAEALADPRAELVVADLLDQLREVAGRGDAGGEGRYDALCLDIDNGPDWTVTPDNESLYTPAGLAACRAALTPGGVLAVWSARPSQVFPRNLRDAGFATVRTREVPVVRGVPDVLFLASHHLASRSA
ncbi:spermidine synthase [Streptomyces radicis]|uniref:Spermidine synthase n=1 Tax=Streptomyces radicis TaxID=1750517 RepID=A0A3A9VZS0_9ACTN|nr:spermidine synthase [Streptomyces radicis]RKN06481.1 spermidine synthase [Streptomyces radicis]RKN20261.1 spermidine synthase [Streptomyces radicis]